MPIALRAENVGKVYRLGGRQRGYGTLRDAAEASVSRLLGRARVSTSDSDQDFWALRDVSFELAAGDQLGIIGRNGAGKSTLLKLLSRITEPSAGRISISGRVASLLEVGTGFHPELSGRENIYLNAAILGMKRHEIRHKFDEIVEFAEVERFLDTPVKRYSSGMYVRLAFSVAAHLEPDIFIIDEVLAVGDRQFQDKCMGRMEAMSTGEGRTILFVSHNLDAIRRFCSKAIYLSEGRLKHEGTVSQVISSYLNATTLTQSPKGLNDVKDRWGDGEIKITGLDVSCRGQRVDSLSSGGDYDFTIIYEAPSSMATTNAGIVSIAFANEAHITVLLVSTQFSAVNVTFHAGEGSVVCTIRDLNLAPGDYTVTLFLGGASGRVYDCLNDVVRLTVAGGDYFGTNHPGLPSHCSTLTRAVWDQR